MFVPTRRTAHLRALHFGHKGEQNGQTQAEQARSVPFVVFLKSSARYKKKEPPHWWKPFSSILAIRLSNGKQTSRVKCWQSSLKDYIVCVHWQCRRPSIHAWFTSQRLHWVAGSLKPPARRRDNLKLPEVKCPTSLFTAWQGLFFSGRRGQKALA